MVAPLIDVSIITPSDELSVLYRRVSRKYEGFLNNLERYIQ